MLPGSWDPARNEEEMEKACNRWYENIQPLSSVVGVIAPCSLHKLGREVGEASRRVRIHLLDSLLCEPQDRLTHMAQMKTLVMTAEWFQAVLHWVGRAAHNNDGREKAE
jgi:hypothetical protein